MNDRQVEERHKIRDHLGMANTYDPDSRCVGNEGLQSWWVSLCRTHCCNAWGSRQKTMCALVGLRPWSRSKHSKPPQQFRALHRISSHFDGNNETSGPQRRIGHTRNITLLLAEKGSALLPTSLSSA